MYTRPPAKKSTGKTTKTTKKTTARRKTSSKSRKPKEYIPAYKIILFCVAIITICMGLLLFTTLSTPKEPSIAQKIEEPAAQKNEPAKLESKPAPVKIETPFIEETPAPKPAESTQSSKPKEPASNEKPAANPPKEKPAQSQSQSHTPAQPPAPAAKPAAKSSYNFPKAKNGAQLIFVFDDGGQNNSQLEKYLTLPFPITVAVLPKLQNSASAAQKVRASGNEVILHQPMQAINASVNPGPGAIKPEMSDEEIKSVLFQNINEIGPIAGMNNHEGSAITADAEKMAVILQMASEEGIYFLDSRTNVDTKVPYVAGEMGYSYFERNIFLDNEKTKENALKELKKGLDIANKNGNVIMIGHVWSADFLPAFLNDIYPELKEKGYTFSVVSKSKARK